MERSMRAQPRSPIIRKHAMAAQAPRMAATLPWLVAGVRHSKRSRWLVATRRSQGSAPRCAIWRSPYDGGAASSLPCWRCRFPMTCVSAGCRRSTLHRVCEALCACRSTCGCVLHTCVAEQARAQRRASVRFTLAAPCCQSQQGAHFWITRMGWDGTEDAKRAAEEWAEPGKKWKPGTYEMWYTLSV